MQTSDNGETNLRVVTGVWNNGQVVMCDNFDAVKATETRPGAKTIVSSGGRKVSVDPIGSIRPAND